MSEAIPVAIGVDFGATSIKIGVCQGEQVLKKAPPIPTPQFESPAEIIAAMCETIKGLQQECPAICAVGLGMPGWVDFHRGVLYQLTNVPVWNMQVAVKSIMEAELALPVALDNDANCMAYAEWKLGAGKGMSSLVSLTLGTGVGGGIIVCNQVLRGLRVSAGELGMTSIDFQGKAGPFGNRGGVEEYIGNNEMAADAMQRYAAAGISKTVEDCTPYALELAARSGDEIAKQCYLDFAQKLATLIMNLMYTIVPEAFIIGGGIAKADDLLFEPLDAYLKEQLFPVHYDNLSIVSAQFGNDAGMLGAALMAAELADA